MAALVPTLEQMRFVRIEWCAATAVLLAPGRATEPEIAIDRRPANSSHPGNVRDCRSLRVQRDHLLVARDPRRVSLLTLPLDALLPRLQGRSRKRWGRWRTRLFQSRPPRLQEAFEGIAEVLQEMEAVSDLCGIRRAACRAIRREIATVPGDYPDTERCTQPRGDGIGGTIRQEINRRVPFEVTEDRAVTSPFRPCPVSMPSTCGGTASGSDIARTSRSSVSSLVGIAR